MKMIYVGSLATEPDRDSNWIAAFRKLGCDVVSFCSMPEAVAYDFRNRIRRRLHIGGANRKMQLDLLAKADLEQPAWIHFRLPIQFDYQTIRALKKKGIIVTQYFNDDPFSARAPFGLYWKFHRAITSYDAHFVYRLLNIRRYHEAGASNVEHCAPTYDPMRHYCSSLPLSPSDFLADAAFIGHFENDWRLDCLDALKKSGCSVILKGGMWRDAIRGREISSLDPIEHAFGAEYNYIYSHVVAGLCFFSKINNDSWTERALEIVAVGGVLVCERTDEALRYFKDREEALFFSSIEELIQIVNHLKTNPEFRQNIRAAGFARLNRGHDTINDRALQVYEYVRNRVKMAVNEHGK